MPRPTQHSTIRDFSSVLSDLMVGMECHDVSEILYEIKVLRRLSEENDAPLLASTADRIEQSAKSLKFQDVDALISELKRSYHQTFIDWLH